MLAMQETLRALRRELAALETGAAPGALRFTLGLPVLDAHLGGGLGRGALHEFFAAEVADAAAAAGFAAALTLRILPAGRRVVWVRQTHGESETGALYPPGLAALGFDPDSLIMVRTRDGLGTLRAGIEAVRCPALGAVVIEPWGSPKALDFSASRRLSLAAARSGVTTLLLRTGAEPCPNAAQTRWQVAAVASRPLGANAPGHPAFEIVLLRHRAGVAGLGWRLEWDHEYRVFREAPPLSGDVAALPARRPAQSRDGPLALAG